MPTSRPFVLSIAGFDPSAGAGVLADIKTFEQHRVYGFAITTANTIQTENEFISIQWTPIELVLQSIQTLFSNYEIKAVKIGIVPSVGYLKKIILLLKQLSPSIIIVWDTILKSSTEFGFLDIENQNELLSVLSKIDLITPNYTEVAQLGIKENTISKTIDNLNKYCSVLLKGGHNLDEIGTDYLYTKDLFFRIIPINAEVYAKHGSGCVLSAAITANLATENNLLVACKKGKKYIESFLLSNTTQLGYHYV
ncbi:hydroxymethylpyrimidine/phosphomethylpyrimidine kinase [Flavobacterium sp. 7A]|uniref:hydroxymethylpyrimidine/phosphomethylpyrimidine kinase n=1 Tax=Flavobacterium sp. 7A TaxID=2940571 RepID=UPI002227B270|nr:hydroxymethylpyrimidine/phosphomethylpyrimidine kinase [Flavobacterium sp. 7A]MCW2118091.1 hydroxymethylpyrimidine/phosphomethylpyrimidine kinase [Flavobacterium sp. 7A]